MAVRVITPPTGLIVPLDEVKRHLRVTWSDEDMQITAFILAAWQFVENFVQRRYFAQTLEYVRDSWCDAITLPLAPTGEGGVNASIVSVSYVAADGTTQVLPASTYWDRPDGQTRAFVRRWYSVLPWLGDGAERVVIRFSFLGDVSTVPPLVTAAVKLLVAHWYVNREAVVGVENRDSSTELPIGFRDLLISERWN